MRLLATVFFVFSQSVSAAEPVVQCDDFLLEHLESAEPSSAYRFTLRETVLQPFFEQGWIRADQLNDRGEYVAYGQRTTP
jgi:hypothetical protein